jgi:hypothetical protein
VRVDKTIGKEHRETPVFASVRSECEGTETDALESAGQKPETIRRKLAESVRSLEAEARTLARIARKNVALVAH